MTPLNEHAETMYLRSRLVNVLSQESSLLQQYAPFSLERAEALLLTPPWMYPIEQRERFEQELLSLKNFEEDMVIMAGRNNLLQPHMWQEESIHSNLLSICSLARFNELFASSLVDAYLGGIQLAFIENKTSPKIKEEIQELLWDLDWDGGSICEVLEDIENNIELAEENIDWQENVGFFAKKVEERLLPRKPWQSWLTQARVDIVHFFDTILKPKPVQAYAASSISVAKPLPTFVLWREGSCELSLTYYEDKPFFQFYGTQSPELFMGSAQLSSVPLPESLNSELLHWWSLPKDFCSSVSMVFPEDEITVSLVRN